MNAPIIPPKGTLATTAQRIVLQHRPVADRGDLVCSACHSPWMCPSHDNAEGVIRAAGLDLRRDDGCDDEVARQQTAWQEQQAYAYAQQHR